MRNTKPYTFKKRSLCKTISLLMVFSLLFGMMIPFSAAAEEGEEDEAVPTDGGFSVSLDWNGVGVDSEHYNYDSSSLETRYVRLRVSYENEKLLSDYNKGQIIISVPGINDAGRGKKLTPVAIAADKASETEKIYDWSYTYDSTTCLYTFTNNAASYKDTVFEGMFEIVWSVDSGSSVDGYEKTLRATLSTINGEETFSNEITYSQIREKFLYTLTPKSESDNTYNPASRVYSAEGMTGLIEEGKEDRDYTFVKYSSFTYTYQQKARSLVGHEYNYYGDPLTTDWSIWIPEGTNICDEKGNVGSSSSFQLTGQTKEIDGITYREWEVHNKTIFDKYHANYLVDNSLIFYAAYPKELYQGENVTIYLEGHGTYYDETEATRYAEQSYTIKTDDYDFLTPGDYGCGVTDYGIGNSYVSQHCTDCWYHGAVSAEDVNESKRDYYSAIVFSYNLNEVNSFEIGEDVFKVLTTNDTYRTLSDNEYHITSITIPQENTLYCINGFRVAPKSYDVEVYVRRAGQTAYERYPTNGLKFGSSSHTVSFADTDIVAASVKFIDLDQSFQNIRLQCSYRYHSDQDDILLDQGSMKHYIFVKRYDADGVLQTHDGETYYLPSDEEPFGYPVLRSNDSIHILIIPSIVNSYVTFSQTGHTSTQYNFSGTIQNNFQLPEGNNLRAFTVFAVVPVGLTLQDSYKTVEKLTDVIRISGLGKTESFLKNHMTMQIQHRSNGAGEEYLVLEMKFDFEEDEIVNDASSVWSNYLYIRGIPMAVNIDELNQRKSSNLDHRTYSFSFYSCTTIDQNGFWHGNSIDSSDIDLDGNYTEPVALDSDYSQFTIAGYAQLESSMSVKTGLSNGYVKPEYDEESETFSGVPETYGNSTYVYRVKFRGNRSTVGNIVVMDSLEDDELSEWHGSLLAVDTSKAAEFTNVEPTLYYSETVQNSAPDFSDTDTWKMLPADLSQWTDEQRSAVKTIAVDFHDAVLIEGQYIYFDIYMTSPDNQLDEFSGTMTVNHAVVRFNQYDDITGLVVAASVQSTRRVAVSMTPYKGTIKIFKQDSEDSSILLSGVVFDLYRKEDDVCIEGNIITDEEGRAQVRDIPYGDYYLKEVRAAKGYILPDKAFDFSLGGPEPDCILNITVRNVRKSTLVSLTKYSDRQSSLGLAGAKFRIHTADGAYFNDAVYTTDDSGKLTIAGIPWGSYYLEEVQPPAGFTITDEAKHFSFTVDASNDSGRELNLSVSNSQIPGTVVMQKYERLNDGSNTETPLSKAFYNLYNADNDRLLGTYQTDSNGRLRVDDLTFGDYYFKETVSSVGYLVNPDQINFTINGEDDRSDGTVVEYITTYDQRKTGTVWMDKTDDQGDPVKGACYGIFRQSDDVRVNAHGEPLQNLLSMEGLYVTDSLGSAMIDDLWWGDYYLKEVSAPAGYQVSEEKYPFSVNKNTVRTNIRIRVSDNRMKGTVRLIKVNKDDTTQHLPNAVYSMYQSDGQLVRSGIITGADGTVMIENIPWGTYYLQEEQAPTGFGLSDEKIRFTVNYISAGKTQEITAEDKQAAGEVKIKKRIRLDDVVTAHGNPTFLFKINGTNSVTNSTYQAYKSVTFAEDYITSLRNTGNVEYAEMSVLFTDVPTGTCTVSEVEVQRYEVSDITDISSNGVLNQNNTVTFTITSDNLQCEAVFTNDKSVQSNASHTAAEVNMLKKSRKVTSLSAIWTGDGSYTQSMLDRSMLDVYVIYDDGTSEKLPDDAYELWSDGRQLSQDGVNDFDPATTMTTTIEVRYLRSGRTYTDSFDLTIVVMLPFTYKVLDRIPFSENGVEYAGTVAITGYLGNSTNIAIPQKVIGERTLTNNSTGAYTENISANVYKVVGLESIASSAAYGFTNAETVTLPPTVKEIGSYALSNGSGSVLNDINLDQVEEIGSYAFAYCHELTSANLASAKLISNSAFYSCTALDDIHIGDDIQEVGQNAFYDTSFYNNSADGLIYLDGKVLYGYHGTAPTGELNVDNGTLCIANNAFQNHTGITGLNLPDSLRFIGHYSFFSCTGLSSLSLPENLQRIGGYAFYKCSGLTGALTIPDHVISIGYNYHGQYISSGCTDGYSFYQCKNITAVDFGNSVKDIGPYCFSSCTGLQSVTFDSSLETIAKYAFQNDTSIERVVIPDSVINLGTYVFNNCTGLQKIIIGEGLTEIPNNAFSNCGSQSAGEEPLVLTFGSNVRTIGDYAFYQCVNLKGNGGSSQDELVFPDGLTSIGSYAFRRSELGTIRLPDSVTYIGPYAFSDSTGLSIPASRMPAGVTSISSYTFSGSAIGSQFTIDSSISSIGEGAFAKTAQLSDLTIENGVSQISGKVFIYSGIGPTVSIPESVTTIDYNPFPVCRQLQAIEVDPDNPSYVAVDGVLYTQDMQTLVCYPAGKSISGFVVPSTVTTIGPYAFAGCDLSDGFVLPDTVTEIGDHAFSECSLPDDFIIPDSLDYIPDYAFYNCTNMTEFTIRSHIVRIGKSAFEGCTGLTEITIPDNVTVMGNNTFAGCTSLKDVSIGTGLNAIPDCAFMNTAITDLEIPDNIVMIGSGAFRSCKDLTEIILPEYLGFLAKDVFSECISLTGISIPDSVEIIRDHCFYGCSSLSSIDFGSGLKTISMESFMGCSSLTEIVIPEGVRRVGSRSFMNCTQLKKVFIPNSVCSIEQICVNYPRIEELSIGSVIGSYPLSQLIGSTSSLENIKTLNILDGTVAICSQAIQGCRTLENVTIPNSVVDIGSNVFIGISTIKHVTIGDALDYGTTNSYSGGNYWTMQKLFPDSYRNITSVEILDGLGRINSGAFTNCTSLTDVTVGDSVIAVTKDAFQNTALLTNAENGPVYIGGKILYTFKGQQTTVEFEIPNGIVCIADYAFQGYSRLNAVHIPASVKGIGTYAFQSCRNLSYVDFASMNNLVRLGYRSFYNTAFVGTSGGGTGITNGQATKIDSNYLYFVASDNSLALYSSDASVSEPLNVLDKTVCIAENAFSSKTITALTLPDTVKSIGWGAFNRCTALQSVDLGNGLVDIGDTAFQGCTKLKTLVIPDSTEIIRKGAFYGCSQLNSLSLGDHVRYIGTAAFQGAVLTSITIPGSVKVIATSAFTSITAARSLVLGDGVECIAKAAFAGLRNLNTLKLGNGTLSLGASSFSAVGSGSGGITNDVIIPLGINGSGGSFSGARINGCIYVPDYPVENNSIYKLDYYLGLRGNIVYYDDESQLPSTS